MISAILKYSLSSIAYFLQTERCAAPSSILCPSLTPCPISLASQGLIQSLDNYYRISDDLVLSRRLLGFVRIFDVNNPWADYSRFYYGATIAFRDYFFQFFNA
jgi:hypothetical protein